MFWEKGWLGSKRADNMKTNFFTTHLKAFHTMDRKGQLAGRGSEKVLIQLCLDASDLLLFSKRRCSWSGSILAEAPWLFSYYLHSVSVDTEPSMHLVQGFVWTWTSLCLHTSVAGNGPLFQYLLHSTGLLLWKKCEQSDSNTCIHLSTKVGGICFLYSIVGSSTSANIAVKTRQTIYYSTTQDVAAK